MPRLSTNTRQELHEVLLHFDINAADLHDIRSGRVNKHWRVESPTGRYVLRRYNPQRSSGAIRYEHDVLRHIAQSGWPVAVPLQADDGATVVSEFNSRYSLFPFLPGRPGPEHDQRYLRIKGGLLARLHGDLATLPSCGKREGFGLISDLDAYVPRSDGGTFDAILDSFGQVQPGLADQIRTQRHISLEELARLGYDSLPDTLVHGDFHAENIFFYRRQLTAILDFDFVHLDKRIADLALAIAEDCPEPPGYMAIDPESVRALVGAYHTESPLSEKELGLIVPLVRTYYVWLCWYGITRWLGGDAEKATSSLGRTLTQRLPNLEDRMGAIESSLPGS